MESVGTYLSLVKDKNFYSTDVNFYHTIYHIQDLLEKLSFFEPTIQDTFCETLKAKYAADKKYTYIRTSVINTVKYYHYEYIVRENNQYVTKTLELSQNELLEFYKFYHNPHLLALAITYHDAFYKPGFKGNEDISASIADFELRNYLNNEDRKYVCDLIRSTKADFDFNSIDCAKNADYFILHDLDWSRFAKDSFVDDDQKVLLESITIILNSNQELNQELYNENQLTKYIRKKQKEFYLEWKDKFQFYVPLYDTNKARNKMSERFNNINVGF